MAIVNRLENEKTRFRNVYNYHTIMKTKILILLSALSLTANAQETTSMTVGYCGDASTDAIGLSEKDVNIAAVHYTSDLLKQYAGNEVKSVVIQLGASFGSAGSVFVADALNDDAATRYPIDIEIPNFDFVRPYEWVEVPLDQPISISEDHPFYVGIRIEPYKSAPYYGKWQFAVDENPLGSSHCSIYDAAKKKWAPLSSYTFEDCTAPNFLIKLRLEGDALPKNDVAVAGLQTIDYMRTTETCSCTFDVTNVATNEITSFDVDLLLDGVIARREHYDLDTPLAMNASTTVKFDDISFSSEGTHTIAVRVTNINGIADVHPENNIAEREVSVIDRYFDHTVLVEAFTTMSCANCPGAHERADAALDHAERVVRVDHHSGFGTDILTTNVDTDFLWFYNNGGTTYAPGMMFDRAMIDDFFDPQRSPGEEHTPIVGPGDTENIAFIHQHLSERPAYVDVHIDADYRPSDRTLSITVSGEAIAKLPGDNPTINVWLTESGLSAADNPRYGQMTGSGKLDMTFVHNNTLRSSLTGSWGQSLSLGLAPYSKSYTTTLPAGWVAENMEIVAFISNYDSHNPDNCLVHNSAALPLRHLLAPVDGVVSVTPTADATPTFDLSGRTILPATKGVFIRNGRKMVK